MNEVNSLKKSLPEMEHSFSLMNERGNLTNKEFSGNFTCKIPNLKTLAKIEKHVAILNGGLAGLDSGTLKLHAMLAHLRYTLTDAPKWWKDSDMGYDLYDISIIEKIHEQVIAFENEWYESVWGKPEDKSQNEQEKA